MTDICRIVRLAAFLVAGAVLVAAGLHAAGGGFEAAGEARASAESIRSQGDRAGSEFAVLPAAQRPSIERSRADRTPLHDWPPLVAALPFGVGAVVLVARIAYGFAVAARDRFHASWLGPRAPPEPQFV